MNKKITLMVIFLFMTFTLQLFCQTSASSDRIDETTIVFADETSNNDNSITSYKAPSTIGIFVRMIVALVIVAGLIYWLLRVIKKKTNVTKTEDDFLRRAASISVGNNQTVEVVTLIDRAYVIGVSEGKITLLDEITDEKERDKDLIESMNLNADKKQNTKKPVKFSEVLDMFTKKTASSKVENEQKKSVFNSSEEALNNLLKKTDNEE